MDFDTEHFEQKAFAIWNSTIFIVGMKYIHYANVDIVYPKLSYNWRNIQYTQNRTNIKMTGQW